MDPTRTATARTGPRTGPGTEVRGSDRPRLARHVRLTFCRTRRRPILLHPETVVVLNGSGAAILELCDGRHTVTEIVTELGGRYRTVPGDEVRRFLARLVARRWMELSDG
ncbi:pyrroloquinoline quinone biosynthesis peptide chaperone PqqD [Actinacidiphila sp. bgisy160]|uniref:pyrroloquinoline quinone biosynthesis peptide chaperone PqqD n=1 Tax=Actinacidiphila sp. bgisy160 TaxID=3413796 RepID=UPI003D7242E3